MPGLVALLASFSSPQSHVIIEEAQAMPGQGTRSMFTIALGMGVWLGILGALGLAHTRVRPGVWKRTLGLASDKEQARLRAMQLYPSADLRRKKDHGRAEALLLAHYGWQRMHDPHSSCGARDADKADREWSDTNERCTGDAP